MRRYISQLTQVLRDFYGSAGLGVVCYDVQLHMVCSFPDPAAADLYARLGVNRAFAFIARTFSQPSINTAEHFTVFLTENIVCNIVFLAKDGVCLGVLVTEPVLLRRLRRAETEVVLGQLAPSAKDHPSVSQMLAQVQIIPYERVIAMSAALHALTGNLFSPRPVHQVRAGSAAAVPLPPPKRGAMPPGPPVAPMKHVQYSTYHQMLQCIQRGDPDTLQSVMSQLQAHALPAELPQGGEALRALRNDFVKACALGCYAAVESGAVYDKVMEAGDAYILQMERLNSPQEIVGLMQEAMISFARFATTARSGGFSRPVRLVLDYIDTHYNEKITLEVLAQHTDLSTFYLSSLIKRETGLNLTENIHQTRIKAAKKLLLDRNASVLDVAQQVGFIYQNHFSAVFRKYTGMTPSEYRQTLGGEEGIDQPPLSASVAHAYERLVLGCQWYDVARLVDPTRKRSWIIKAASETTVPGLSGAGTCYQYWSRGQCCENCASEQAYQNREMCAKLERRGEVTHLVLAIPQFIGRDIYVVEVIKVLSANGLMEGAQTRQPADA